jgi:rubrerythrin
MQVNFTEKETMLLKQQKDGEQLCIDKYTNYVNQTNDPQLKQILNDNLTAEKQHLNTLTQMLNGTMPNLNQNQQQNQAQNQMQSQSQNNMTNNMNQQTMSAANNVQPAGMTNTSDAQICKDILVDEEHISTGYNNAIFQFTDHKVRDTLNHIQKEEQEHGEAVYNYMKTKGMC